MREKILFFIIFIGFIEYGYALKCFQCNSTKDADCLENFQYFGDNGLKSVICPVDKSKFCIKTTGVFGSVVGVTRFCSSMDMGNQCQYLPFIDHDRTYRGCVFTCTGDECNSGNNVSLFNIVFISAILIVLFYLHIND